ncbi:MAG TPA: ABC transporter permease [Clostridia bacterium]|jgi:spermidine/putrescine transport system permease protein|nr:ABC transporter permease [Clostridia bacterium]
MKTNVFTATWHKIKNFRMTRKVFSYPYILFLLLFVVIPMALVLVYAFLDSENSLTFANFITIFTDGASMKVLLTSLLVGVVTTVICFIIGYPVAYILSRRKSGKTLVLLFVLPMWVNFLIRTLATKAIFIALDIELGMGTVLFGMVYNYLPFMILPLHTVLSNIDKSYEEAARDLGADGLTLFIKSTLPLSIPGIISGITMVFIPTISTLAISQLLSDYTIFLFGDSIQTKFNNNLYGVGSVMSLIMLIFVLVSNFFMNKVSVKQERGGNNLW